MAHERLNSSQSELVFLLHHDAIEDAIMLYRSQHILTLVLLVFVSPSAWAEDSDESKPFKPDVDFWVEAATKALAEKQHAEAYLAANKILEIGEDKDIRSLALSIRASVRLNNKRFEAAIAEATNALELNQDNEWALIIRVVALIKLDRFDLAIKDCDRLVKLDPKDGEAFYYRGKCWLKTKEWDKAVADATRAIDLEPDDVDAYSLRAQAYANHKQYRLAIADYKRAGNVCRDDDAEFTAIVFTLISCPIRQYNDYDAAIQLVRQRCDATNSKDVLWISMLASLYAEAGDFPSAVEYGRKAVGLATGEDRKLAEHNLELFSAGKTLKLANEELWDLAEPMQR
jgi:tetratricopeptide (TPR) repeat protein